MAEHALGIVLLLALLGIVMWGERYRQIEALRLLRDYGGRMTDVELDLRAWMRTGRKAPAWWLLRRGRVRRSVCAGEFCYYELTDQGARWLAAQEAKL